MIKKCQKTPAATATPPPPHPGRLSDRTSTYVKLLAGTKEDPTGRFLPEGRHPYPNTLYPLYSRALLKETGLLLTFV